MLIWVSFHIYYLGGL